MALRDRFSGHIFSTRGWGLLAAGAVSLLAAQIMGRRDLLALAVLLLLLPLLALAGTRVLKPRFRVYREFGPSPVEASARTTVRLAIARNGPGTGHAIMEEHLPARFGESPVFLFPARGAPGGTSRYEYHLRSAKRGQFVIGPVTAEFSDPFGLSFHRHAIDDGDLLTVTPAAVELPETGLAGARGNDGVTATRIRANPSDDDVMTREYRHGDPMRRVHWAATARHGSLMVRQEESVTTPEATIILDHRLSAYPHGVFGHGAFSSARPGSSGSSGPAGSSGSGDGHELLTCDTFEWAVTAAMSIAAHLAERSYTLRFLDSAGAPAFRQSPSAPDPEAEEYGGTAGLQSIAESLAAIQLSGPQHPHPHRTRGGNPRTLPGRQPRPSSATKGDRAAFSGQAAPAAKSAARSSAAGSSVVAATAARAFDDTLMDKLSAHRLRGPILAVLGNLTASEARALSPAAAFGANAFALLVTDHLHESGEVLEVMEVLRLGGWRAVAVSARSSLPDAWAAFDAADPAMSAAADVRRGARSRL
ncbi:DUF58 domain-containing protein [Arthrobacter sp. NPDC058192]|uniref:DUF58 domain-containing protein n=1 Tax=Arthrobacter sp. NPDC058192 TaxID=3346372 RepID=UPI0036EC87B3